MDFLDEIAVTLSGYPPPPVQLVRSGIGRNIHMYLGGDFPHKYVHAFNGNIECCGIYTLSLLPSPPPDLISQLRR